MPRPARCTIGRVETRPRVTRKAARRAPDHLAWLRTLECPVHPGERPIEAHHLLQVPDRGVGMRAQDRDAVPLSRKAHHELHDYTTGVKSDVHPEVLWQASHHLDLLVIAKHLWSISGDTEAAQLYLAKVHSAAVLKRMAQEAMR